MGSIGICCRILHDSPSHSAKNRCKTSNHHSTIFYLKSQILRINLMSLTCISCNPLISSTPCPSRCRAPGIPFQLHLICLSGITSLPLVFRLLVGFGLSFSGFQIGQNCLVTKESLVLFDLPWGKVSGGFRLMANCTIFELSVTQLGSFGLDKCSWTCVK